MSSVIQFNTLNNLVPRVFSLLRRNFYFYCYCLIVIFFKCFDSSRKRRAVQILKKRPGDEVEKKTIFDSFVLLLCTQMGEFPNKPQVLKAKDYQ